MDGFEALKRSAGRYPLLTAEQEIELGRTIQEWQQWPGGPDAAPRHIRHAGRKALDQFLLANQRLALHIAGRFAGHGIAMEDLAMAGIENLITACRRFDPARGFRFSSYAVWYIVAACQQITRQQSTAIRLPASIHDAVAKLTKARERLTTRGPATATGRRPTAAELAAETGLDEALIFEAEHALHINRTLAIDSQDGDEHRGVVSHEIIGTDGGVTLETLDLRRCICEAINSERLSPQQRYILRNLYLREPPLSVQAIGQHLNLSKAVVLQLAEHAISRLQQDPRLREWSGTSSLKPPEALPWMPPSPPRVPRRKAKASSC